ncbi:MAG: MFS transporter [Rhizobiales bacterium 32-66-11]|nr:MAG: MFS transporter [Rhizobiales bacterium 32-66-11]
MNAKEAARARLFPVGVPPPSGSADMPFLLVLGLAGFASAFSMRAVDPMLNLLAADLAVTLQRAALLASAFSLPYAAMQLVFGPIGDAVGKVRLIRVTLSMLCLGLIGCALAPSHDALMAGRIFSGGWAGGVIPVALATVGDRVTMQQRPQALGRLLMAIVLGQLGGAMASGMISTLIGWRAVFWCTAAVAGTAAVGAMFFLTETAIPQRPSLRGALARYRVVFGNPLSIRLFLVAAIEGALIFGVFPFVAAHMVGRALGDAVEAGFALGMFGLGGVIYTFLVAVLVRRLGLSGMAGLGATVAGVCLIAIALVPALGLMLALFGVLGFGFYMIHNTLQIMATELVPAARGSAVALYATFFFSGQALGALLAAQLIGLIGPVELFAGAGVGLIALAFPASRLPRRLKPVEPEPVDPSA